MSDVKKDLCNFCQNSHNGDELHDKLNGCVNQEYLTLFGNQLRLWERYSYKGCYEINYCPICGRNLKK